MAYKAQKVQKVMVQPIVLSSVYMGTGKRDDFLLCLYEKNLIFRYLQNRSRIQVWLYEQTNMRIEGHIIGFDEYMNLVLDEAEEVHLKRKTRKSLAGSQSHGSLALGHRKGKLPEASLLSEPLMFSSVKKNSACPGRILLKGDNITLIMSVAAPAQ